MWIFLPPQEQFKKLLPWECLDTFLIELEGMHIALVAPTVGAALIHFDTVVYFVISTCLETGTMKAQDRARVLELWIQVARECNKLSNYSSLHGIVTALKAAPIHSLQETWRAVSRESARAYKELCTRDDRMTREKLIKLGISKLARREKNPQRAQMRQQRRKGVIPFLGIFVDDLTLLQKWTQNNVAAFKIVQQLQLLQVTANNFCFQPDRDFQSWLQTMKPLDNILEGSGIVVASDLSSPQPHPSEDPELQVSATLSG
ncbi:ral-GDS-related protein-like [Nycticebus coucang]|uniref:ral-GDS-related protein-like n=1 Tax=Nycticebus coucang TaxID=9470 RepID=UPI00234CAC83|nr:ral-GDS-related protein-like [Nycticebus coucang]